MPPWMSAGFGPRPDHGYEFPLSIELEWGVQDDSGHITRASEETARDLTDKAAGALTLIT